MYLNIELIRNGTLEIFYTNTFTTYMYLTFLKNKKKELTLPLQKQAFDKHTFLN